MSQLHPSLVSGKLMAQARPVLKPLCQHWDMCRGRGGVRSLPGASGLWPHGSSEDVCRVARTWADSWEAEWAGEGCPKCAQGRPDQDEYGVRWYADEFADAYLLRQTPSTGYTAVIFRGRHVPDPALFTDAE